MTEEIELWGTFSVADHFRRNPFVTDVLLYDQLVIPVPVEDDLKEEWKRWDKDKQGRLLGELGNLVVPMPWGIQQSQIFKERFKANTRIVEELGYVRNAPPDEQAQYVTRDLLKDYANEELDNQLFRQSQFMTTAVWRIATPIEQEPSTPSRILPVRSRRSEGPNSQYCTSRTCSS